MLGNSVMDNSSSAVGPKASNIRPTRRSTSCPPGPRWAKTIAWPATKSQAGTGSEANVLLALTGPSCDGASPATPALEADRADQDDFADPPNGEAPEGRLAYGLQELPHDNPNDANVEPLFRATADRPTPPTGELIRWQTGLACDRKFSKGVATTERVGTVGVRDGAAIGAARPSRCGRPATRLAALVMPRQSRVSRRPE